MKSLFNYLFAHFKTVSFISPFVFFVMDMSGILGGWVYYLYYPMLFIIAIFSVSYSKKYSIVHILYLIICLISILLNDIPSYYRIYSRYIVFILLLLSFSNLVNSRKIALMRLHAFHIFSILAVILVTINYILFHFGYVNNEAISMYEESGIYTGSTANNEMGLLGAISIMFIVVYISKYIKEISVLSKITIFICLISSISMMAMASSRMGLICSVISVILVLYKLNRYSIKNLIITSFIVIIGSISISIFLGSKFKYMMEKNNNQIEHINFDSRDDMWQSRFKEFKESPLFGIGFGYMKYGWGNQYAEETGGRIESGSGWISVISQTGILGAICMFFMIIPNILFILKNKSTSYCSAWYSGMCVMFLLQPITEAYITTVGAVLCCLFWLNYGVIDSFRKGILKESDLDLSMYSKYKLFDKRLLRIKHK